MSYLAQIANLEESISNNINLGMRQLLDLVYDSNNMELYEWAINTVKLKEAETDLPLIKEHIDKIIQKLKTLNIHIVDNDFAYFVGSNIEKAYKSSFFKLGPVNTSVKAREVVGLVGENGNGKTTLLRIIARDLEETNGLLEYNGEELEHRSLYNLRSKIAYIPQRTDKWFGSLKDNLRFALACHKTPSQEIELRMLMMIARLGLWKYQDLKWKELSSGYKMRFELARALLTRPKLLILDEPLANLDIFSQQTILEDIKMMAQALQHPMGVILSSQQLYEVEKHSHKVIFLKDGELKGLINRGEEPTSTENEIVLEIDSPNSKQEILDAFAQYSPKFEDNGGMYILHLQTSSMTNIWQTLAKSDIKIIMLRDITKSTRRFF